MDTNILKAILCALAASWWRGACVSGWPIPEDVSDLLIGIGSARFLHYFLPFCN